MSDVITRDNYYERQFLRPEDFTDEQAYHIAMRRDHLIASHSWGIVEGLQITVTDGTPYVQPGVAIDGYGRELILTELTPLPVQQFALLGLDLLNVWLFYGRVGSESAPAGYVGCGTTDLPFYRWVERPVPRLLPPSGDDTPDPRIPPDVPDADINFPPSRLPPDDPARPWPVFLGQLRQVRSTPQPQYVPDPAGRPYAGLVGEQVAAPSGRAQLQLGAEQDNDHRRFAVWVPAQDPNGPRLEIDDDGPVSVRGNVTVHGDVTLDGGLELGVGPAQATPSPWSMSLVQQDQAQELRVELPAPSGGSPAQVSVGHWDADTSQFKPCLTVGDDCTVTVTGDLVVEGSLTMHGDLVTPDLGPEARRAALSSFLTGVGGASTLLSQFYQSQFPSPALASETGLRRIARELADNPGRRAAFAAVVKESHPDLADQLAEDLRPAPGAG